MALQQPIDSGLRELALFAGAGGGILGGKLLGWRTVCAVEYEPSARDMLMSRQNDGCLDPFPIWDDVRTFDGCPWCGVVDIVTGGFPCQDISAAGKGAGIEGERSGLWGDMARIIREVGPRFVLVENSPVLTSRGLGVVLGDLAAMGYDARWGVLGTYHAGGPVRRERLWIAAVTTGGRLARRHYDPSLENREIERRSTAALGQNPSWPDVSNPRAFGDPDRLARQVDRLHAIGNGQSPAVVALAWQILNSENAKPSRPADNA